MLGWITGLFRAGAAGVRDLIDRVRRALTTVWRVAQAIFSRVGNAWDAVIAAARRTADALWAVARAAYNALRHLVTKVIPDAARWAVRTAVRWARERVRDLWDWIRGAVKWLRERLVAMIAAVRKWAGDAIRWLRERLADAWNLLTRTARRVWNLLDEPRHLVAWAGGWIVKVVLRFLERNLMRFARGIIAAIMAASLSQLGRIESIMARLLGDGDV